MCYEFAKEAGSPPRGFVELPTCPVCLERFDQGTSGIQTTLCDHSFHCPCILKWTYLSCQVCRLCQLQDKKPSCAVCGALKNLWVCVICGFVGCGRYDKRHAIRHWKDTQHCYTLGLETQQVWDYVGHSYVHRLNQSKVDGNSAMMNSNCKSHHGECGTCGCSEDSGITGALLDSKVEAITDKYNRLLATQMETQRQHFESLLIEAKSRNESSISDAVEKALASRIQDFQSKLEKCFAEKKAVADTNEELMKNQEILRKDVKEVEERKGMSSRCISGRKVDEGIFQNQQCKCGRKAAVGISESNDNPGQLYYRCANKQCSCFAWWSDPSLNEVRNVDEELESRNFEYIKVKDDVRAITNMMRDLEATQLSLKFILLTLVLGIWIIVLLMLLILLK